MKIFVTDVAAVVAELPDPQLAFQPLLRREAVEPVRLAIADTLVADVEDACFPISLTLTDSAYISQRGQRVNEDRGA